MANVSKWTWGLSRGSCIDGAGMGFAMRVRRAVVGVTLFAALTAGNLRSQSAGTQAAASTDADKTSNAPTKQIPQDYSLTVSSVQAWTDTGINLRTGEVAQISAESKSTGFEQGARNLHAVPAGASCDPQGAAKSSGGATNLPVSAGLPGALIGKVGSGTAFLIGINKEVKAEQEGHLFLGPNISSNPECKGTYSVKVHLAAGASDASKPADIKSKLTAAAQVWMAGQFGSGAKSSATTNSAGSAAMPGGSAAGSGTGDAAAAANAVKPLHVSADALDPKLAEAINALPRRVNDEFKNPGDMVNFVIVGSEKDVQSALESANWFVADRNNAEAVAKAVLMTYQKKDYLQMPMSLLYLFDRVQDYGYEQAEPYSVVASRHHFRIWKAPFQYNGKDAWVGAGTHDIGFEKDQRNGKVTHKIDPAVDGERDNIAGSLEKSGKVKTITYYTPPNSVQDARNATGGGYHSDGRIVVITLQ